MTPHLFDPNVTRAVLEGSIIGEAENKILAFAKNNKDLKKLLIDAREGAGGDIYIVPSPDPKLPAAAFWDFRSRTIGINTARVKVEDDIIPQILFELLNASNTKKLKGIDSDGELGKLSRIKYVMLIERTEFDSTKLAYKIAKAGSDAKMWGNTVSDLFAGPSRLPFNLYLSDIVTQVDKMTGKSHVQVYGGYWNDFASEWFKKNKGGNPDLMTNNEAKNLDLTTTAIKAVQDSLKSVEIKKE